MAELPQSLVSKIIPPERIDRQDWSAGRPLVFTNGVFGLFTIWLPEMFPSALRGAGSGFCFSLGRILGAAGPTLIGVLAAKTGSMPLAISLLSLIYLIGLPLIRLAPETAGKPLAR